jgi:hypothetical protein
MEARAKIEEREVGEMIGARNKRRSERDARLLTRWDINSKATEEQRRSLDRARRRARTTRAYPG